MVRLGVWYLESILDHWEFWLSLLSKRRMEAHRRNASAERFRHSPSLGEAAAAVEPGDGGFDDPALRQHDEFVQVAVT